MIYLVISEDNTVQALSEHDYYFTTLLAHRSVRLSLEEAERLAREITNVIKFAQLDISKRRVSNLFHQYGDYSFRSDESSPFVEELADMIKLGGLPAMQIIADCIYEGVGASHVRQEALILIGSIEDERTSVSRRMFLEMYLLREKDFLLSDATVTALSYLNDPLSMIALKDLVNRNEHHPETIKGMKKLIEILGEDEHRKAVPLRTFTVNVKVGEVRKGIVSVGDIDEF